jgi:hypothetical protein
MQARENLPIVTREADLASRVTRGIFRGIARNLKG